MSYRILLTGDRGYIGTVMSGMLLERGFDVVGLDAGYFESCVLDRSERDQEYPRITKDIRDICDSDLDGLYAVIHLAGLSNDPLGELAPDLTEEINFAATLKLGRLSKSAGVRRFVYASSQSMYGISSADGELDEDDSTKNPITAYAKTKWHSEVALKELGSSEFSVTCMRPSTVFGWSQRLRCDIVFNNLVACAFTTGKIEVKSDGTPWRPVVHVRDVCSAFIAGITAPEAIVAGRSYNVGIPNGNFTVRDLAEAAQRAVPGSKLTFTGEHGSDSRTYRVSFRRILTELKDYFKPEWDLDRGGAELVAAFKRIGFTEAQFRGRDTTRLAQLRYLAERNLIGSDLRWSGVNSSLASD